MYYGKEENSCAGERIEKQVNYVFLAVVISNNALSVPLLLLASFGATHDCNKSLNGAVLK